MVLAVEIEFASQFHIQLALADEMPAQLLAIEAALHRFAGGIDGVGDRREGCRQVGHLIRREAFRSSRGGPALPPVSMTVVIFHRPASIPSAHAIGAISTAMAASVTASMILRILSPLIPSGTRR